MGFFVVVEGLTGVGKTCLALGLQRCLQPRHDLALSQEPNKESFAYDELKKMLNLKIEADSWTQALAFAANRADHNYRIIKPYLRNNQSGILICDRYYHSSLVYQSDQEISFKDLLEINVRAETPDLTLFLDAPSATVAKRLGKRSRNSERFHKHLEFWQEKYLSMVEFLKKQDQKIAIIDANQSIESVLKDAIEAINEYGPPWLGA